MYNYFFFETVLHTVNFLKSYFSHKNDSFFCWQDNSWYTVIMKVDSLKYIKFSFVLRLRAVTLYSVIILQPLDSTLVYTVYAIGGCV